MIRKLTVALIAAAAVASFASPAFSQVFNEGYGTGNVQPFRYPVEHTAKRAAHVAGMRAFNYVVVPNTAGLGVYADSPAATGGGSRGYNQVLRQPN